MSTASQGSLSSIDNATTTDFSNRNRNSEHIPPFQGVNVLGYYTTMPELTNRTTQHIIPKAYYENSFKTISRAGMNSIRYLFSWESYEKNPSLFINELTEVAKAADKSGINVIYDNDQYHISSWLDPS